MFNSFCCFELTADAASERILKVGYKLTKLWMRER